MSGTVFSSLAIGSRDNRWKEEPNMRLTRELLGITLALIVGLVACTSGPAAPVMSTSVATSTLLPTTEPTSTPPPTSEPTSTPLPTSTPVPTTEPMSTPAAAKTMASSLVQCDLEPLVVPTRPPETPGYTQLDPDTGLHMTGRHRRSTWRATAWK